MIEHSRLQEANVVAMLNDEAGGDTTVFKSGMILPQCSSCSG